MSTPTTDELQAMACPACGAKPGHECTFIKARRAARRGESMGPSCHQARYDALESGGAA